MNTDVIFLTTMMDILTGPIPAPIADEFSSGGGKKNQEAGHKFFILALDWVGMCILCLSLQINLRFGPRWRAGLGQRVNKSSEKQ